MSSGRNKDLQP